MIRQQLIEQLTREIMNYDAEYRREDAAGGIGSHARIFAAAKGLSTFRAAEATSRARLDRAVRWPGGVGFTEKRVGAIVAIAKTVAGYRRLDQKIPTPHRNDLIGHIAG